MRVINERHLKKVKKSENQFEFNFFKWNKVETDGRKMWSLHERNKI